jgi:DMSO/TMAO reductase YedYZ molybdopterin-dependent catalytic subunit
MAMGETPDWVHGHPHEPNPAPPGDDTHITVVTPGGFERIFTVEDLHALPYIEVHNCVIVSTGHGTTGPFVFGGARLADVLAWALLPGATWSWVDVIGADGFGARLTPADLDSSHTERPIILANAVDGVPLDRARGLIRLIVPAETDDALRQVKWVSRIDIVV